MLILARTVWPRQCLSWCNPFTCQQSECLGCAQCAPSPPPAPLAGANPFADVDYLVPPRYAERVERSIQEVGGPDSELGSVLSHAAGIPVATWIDSVEALSDMRSALEASRRQRRGTGVAALCVIVVYNLPGRDCGAHASAGELDVGDGGRYEREYLVPMAALAAEFPDVPQVFVLEPDR